MNISDLVFDTPDTQDEWERLFNNAFNRLKQDNHQRLMDRYLPSYGLTPDAGGPGRYSFALARPGYPGGLVVPEPGQIQKDP